MRLLFSLCLLALLLLSGCSFGPAQGYPGPERPREELSLVTAPRAVYVLDSYRRLPSDHRTIDGVEVPSRGILLLPGEHRFSFHYLQQAGQERCMTTFSYGHDWYGPPWGPYYGPYRHWYPSYYYRPMPSTRCRITALETTCSGSFSTEANRSYSLEFKPETEKDAPPREVFLVEHESSDVRERVGSCVAGAPVRFWEWLH